MIDQFQPSAVPNNLPRQLMPFIGRQKELAEITDYLAGTACRLLTLVGPGGIGKTRLAIQAAAQLSDRFARRVCFVPLQGVQSLDLLVAAVADALDFTLSGQQEPQTQLLNHLRDQELLLLLDNFEHLLNLSSGSPNPELKEEQPVLTELLQLAPGVKLLITSREALNLQEEWLYPISGMPYPTDIKDANLADYSAVQLFAGCAQRMRPNFSLADEREGVVRICQLVEGTPLAIELAASWAKTMNCADIAAEIQRGLDFLATRLRDIPQRHRSMQGVFDHSWKLLSPAEQNVFQQLAVFRGGFRREAAEQIAGASLITLSALVDKSLLRWEANGRYQVHELLRQYATERLAQSLEAVTQVHERHCAYYAGFMHQRFEGMLGDRHQQTAAEIEAELENIRAAWQWAVEQLNIKALQQLAESLCHFYDFHGLYFEAVSACAKAIQALAGAEQTEQVDQTLLAILVLQSYNYIRLGQLKEAEDVAAQASYQPFDILPLPGYALDPLIPLAILASIRGDYIETAQLGEQVRHRSEAQQHPWNRHVSHYLLGRAALAQGQYETARQYAQQAYALTLETKDRWFSAYCLTELGNVAYARNDYVTAKGYYEASYTIRTEFEDPEGMAMALNHLGQTATAQGDLAEAQQLYRQSLAICRKINNRGGLAAALNGLGTIAVAQADYNTAQEHYGQALQIAAEMRYAPLILSLLTGIGELLLQTGRPERGLELLALVVRHPAGEQESKERAGQRLNHYQAQLPADTLEAAVQQEAQADLKSIIIALQAELAVPPEVKRSTDKVEEETIPPAPERSLPVGLPLRFPSLIEPLTDREKEVLGLIAAGMSNPEIAKQLILAVGTVKYYTASIYGKLGVTNRVKAVARARQLKLI